MGNSDSHSSVAVPAKSSGSVRFCSRREEEVPSARGWWRGGSERAGTRTRGGSYVTQPAPGPPYTSWHYEHTAKATGASTQGQGSQGCRTGFSFSDVGSSERRPLESGGSPKVLLSKDGSMRVEFTASRVEPTAANQTQPQTQSSKGSSLSSDGSWYDSPWGNQLNDNVFEANNTGFSLQHCGFATEGNANNTFFSAEVDVPTAFKDTNGFGSTVDFNTCSSGSRTEDSGIGDSVILNSDFRDFSLTSPSTSSLDNVYSSNNTLLPAFPPAPDCSVLLNTGFCSDPKGSDVTQEKAGLGYSSHTLPCRRPEPQTTSNCRKDFLKSRIQRLSDWTGSLSRKKRRVQEPIGDVFSNVPDSTLWASNPLHSLNQTQTQTHVPPVYHFSSAGNLTHSQTMCPKSHSSSQSQSSDVQRQNVYESFMQELETVCSSNTDRTEPSEGEDEMEGEEEYTVCDHQDVLESDPGVVRRAGWLSFKPQITVNKDAKLELVPRRKWRQYWVTLKGCTLLFYETYGKTLVAEQELTPRYALLADDSVVQAVPEHPKKEHVFCLSNSHGDVYLFQATSQTDLENWVNSIHSASASVLARREGTEDTPRMLRCMSRALLQRIDTDGKMKKMAELQLSVIKDTKSRKAVESQIAQWEQTLEQLNMDVFRCRCYLSSLQGGEPPNPKSLLAAAARTSKTLLGRLGLFSVSSFHALVCSRDESALRQRRRAVGHHRRRGLPSSLKALHGTNKEERKHKRPNCSSNQREVAPSIGRPAAVQLSDPDVFTLNICRLDAGTDFGFAVTGHVDGEGRSHVYIGEVEALGLSAREGLHAGDEVLSVNGAAVSGLDLELMESLFSHNKLQLLLRRDEGPTHPCVPYQPDGLTDPTLPYQPPTHLHTWTTATASTDSDSPVSSKLSDVSDQNVYSIYQTFSVGPVTEVEVPRNPYSREGVVQPASPGHLSVCQRLRRVIEELVATEKSYVKDLVCLFDVYLTPLQKETFLSKDEMEALFGCLPEMLDFQRVFLQTLEERIASCPNFTDLETPEQFKTLLFSLGGSFLYYADHFKHYSGFCANHIKVQKVLERAKTDTLFKHFLEARNPTNQHSSSLESYLIKPVQRVLKYPLLLRELVSLTDTESPEHTHLTEALRAMEKVASHINEMQKIYEDYGCVFDQLVAEQSGPHKQVTEISMGEFLVHSPVVWLNPLPCLGRLRKEPELTLFVFKRAVILVYREKRLKKRMTGSRSADLDPFRFRWLIPVSAVQVRPANLTGSENQCVWELVHSRSEVEGRPETVFQLCSSGLEAKALVLKSLRSVVRERVPVGSLRRIKQSTADRSSSWRRRRQHRSHSDTQSSNHRADGGLEEVFSLKKTSLSGSVLGETCSEPLLPSRDVFNSAGKRTRLCSLTSDLETQLQRLNFTEEERGEGEGERMTHSQGQELRRGSSVRQSPAGDGMDFSSFLERDFSIQSMTSMINEDCFYVPSLQG